MIFCKYKIINLGNKNFNTSENNKIYTNIDCFLCSETIVNNGFQSDSDV